jgi:hypothetical protein
MRDLLTVIRELHDSEINCALQTLRRLRIYRVDRRPAERHQATEQFKIEELPGAGDWLHAQAVLAFPTSVYARKTRAQ